MPLSLLHIRSLSVLHPGIFCTAHQISLSVPLGMTYFSPLPAKLDESMDGIIERNYDVLKGRIPEKKEELILVLDSTNTVD